MTLADSFPLGERLESIHRQFGPRLVVRLFCDFTARPKEKRLLIVSTVTDPPLFFFINSEKAPHSHFDRSVDDHQIAISPSSYDFLEHDSFIDCSVVHDNFLLAEIEGALASDMSRLLGKIDENTAAEILEVIADSDLLSPRHINQISSDIL